MFAARLGFLRLANQADVRTCEAVRGVPAASARETTAGLELLDLAASRALQRAEARALSIRCANLVQSVLLFPVLLLLAGGRNKSGGKADATQRQTRSDSSGRLTGWNAGCGAIMDVPKPCGRQSHRKLCGNAAACVGCRPRQRGNGPGRRALQVNGSSERRMQGNRPSALMRAERDGHWPGASSPRPLRLLYLKFLRSRWPRIRFRSQDPARFSFD